MAVVSRPAGLIVNVHVPHQPSIASFVSCLTPEWSWRQSQILEHLHVHVPWFIGYHAYAHYT